MNVIVVKKSRKLYKNRDKVVEAKICRIIDGTYEKTRYSAV